MATSHHMTCTLTCPVLHRIILCGGAYQANSSPSKSIYPTSWKPLHSSHTAFLSLFNKDKLVLCDLGYHKFWFFHRSHAHGGFSMTCLKKNCGLRIVQDLSPNSGRRKAIRGAYKGESCQKTPHCHLLFLSWECRVVITCDDSLFCCFIAQ